MSKTTKNYSNTIFYRIVCNDSNILDCYVGHSTNFRVRCRVHKSNCINLNSKHYNLNVYRFIRENGGWDNWNIIIIEEKCCNNLTDALRQEKQYIKEFQSSLNSNIPLQTKEEYREANKDKIKDRYKKYKEANKDKIKEYREANKDKIKEYYQLNKDKNKEYYQLNKDKIKEYYQLNKDKNKDKQKQYREANKDKNKEYREANKDKIKNKQKEYYQLNKDKQKKYREANKEAKII